jgi:hypothetical protein
LLWVKAALLSLTNPQVLHTTGQQQVDESVRSGAPQFSGFKSTAGSYT